MKPILPIAAAVCVSVSLALLASCSSRSAAAGPNGGDVVPIQSGAGGAGGAGATKAEVVTNADTGEVMVHTWDAALKNHQPIDAQPMTLGSGDNTMELMPHPLASDPPGRCSRFYGQADWVHSGAAHIDRAWLRHGQGTREDFAWKHCRTPAKEHEALWSEMGEHRGMGGIGGPMGRMGGMGHR